MSRVCPISGKGPLSGNKRSHSLRATRRVQNVNLQKFKINVNGKQVILKMSVRAYRNFIKKSCEKNNKIEEKKVTTKEEKKETVN